MARSVLCFQALGERVEVRGKGATLGRYWQRPSNKEIGLLLDDFDAAGWRIIDPPKYYKVLCPCGAHKRWIHLTPSGSNYAKNARAWLKRQTCDTKGGGGEP